eukprot:TRINITY_DN46106_c0_g1_i2.p2 TRINITY_DN46106_c0_g1~~TRINITY_DN46106_c0_g1_i2.p2  ORF type:complete len:373 (-),score=188.99 TRINITY_DN46106_c0_g1_i2:26-1144(-)
MCPLDTPHGGLAEYTVQDAHNVIKKPELLSHEEAAATLLSGFQSYAAFHYACKLQANDVVLVCSGSFVSDTMHVQLAGALGAKVIVAAATTEEFNMYGDCGSHVVRIIDLNTESVHDGVMKETGGMGVDCVLDLQDYRMSASALGGSGDGGTDNGANEHDEDKTHERRRRRRRFGKGAQPDDDDNDDDEYDSDEAEDGEGGQDKHRDVDDDDHDHDETTAHSAKSRRRRWSQRRPHKSEYKTNVSDDKHNAAPTTGMRVAARARVSKSEIVSCLGVHGTWISCDPALQLDPPDSRQLFLRGASLAFLFPQCWLLAPRKQGRFMHIMKDMLEKVSAGTLSANVNDQTFSLDKIRQAFRCLHSSPSGRVVVRMH